MAKVSLCPTAETLSQLLQRQLPEAQATTLKRHVRECERCRRTLHALRAGARADNATQTSITTPSVSVKGAPEKPHSPKTPDARLLTKSRAEAGPPVEDRPFPPAGEDRTLSPEDAPANPLEVPEVSGYAILAELGRGGMGVVYQAWQEGLNRPVALKMLLDGTHTGARELERFHREAKVVARLDHPNIVRIYDVGEQDGLPFLALEFVDGPTLAGQLDGTPWPARRAAALVEVLARAVQAAHLAGIVHRDLKPANVLLTTAGTPKITDFGLARDLDDDKGLTQTNSILGTPGYMAPEQAAARRQEIGPATDVHALGAILYELLTGRPPFQAGSQLDTLRLVLTQAPAPPRRVAARVPRDLDTICLHCLHKNPKARYATAEELANDLRRFLNGELIRAQRTSGWVRGLRCGRRHPVTAFLLLVILVGAVWAVWKYSSQFQHLDTNQGRLEVEALPARRSPAAHPEPTPAALARRQGQGVLTLRGHTGGVYIAVFSPDGSRIITSSGDNTAKVWDAHHGQELLTLQGHTDIVQTVASSPDGTRIVTGSHDRTAKVWDATTGQELRTLRGHTALVYSVVFSPDGSRILTSSADKTAKIWDAEKGQEIFTLNGHMQAVTSVVFSPDGKRILTGSWDNTAKVWDAHQGQELLTLRAHTSVVHSVAFSPDGTRIVTGSYDRTAKVWDALQGQELLTLRGHTNQLFSVTFSPDGTRIVTGSVDSTAKVWDATKGQELLTLHGHTREVPSVAFSPDGQRILTGSWDRTAKVWDAHQGQEPLTLQGHTSTVTSVAFSPDGRRLFARALDGKMLAWSLQDGKPVDANDPPALTARGPVRSPDGFLRAEAQGNLVAVTDTRLVDPAANRWSLPTLAERQRYHGEQARLAEQKGYWVAAAFHLGRLLLDSPNDADLKHRREQALKNHAAPTALPRAQQAP